MFFPWIAELPTPWSSCWQLCKDQDHHDAFSSGSKLTDSVFPLGNLSVRTSVNLSLAGSRGQSKLALQTNQSWNLGNDNCLQIHYRALANAWKCEGWEMPYKIIIWWIQGPHVGTGLLPCMHFIWIRSFYIYMYASVRWTQLRKILNKRRKILSMPCIPLLKDYWLLSGKRATRVAGYDKRVAWLNNIHLHNPMNLHLCVRVNSRRFKIVCTLSNVHSSKSRVTDWIETEMHTVPSGSLAVSHDNKTCSSKLVNAFLSAATLTTTSHI